MRRVEGGKMEGDICWKSGGGRTRLYTWPEGSGWQMKPAHHAIPEAAGR
jgi:hypothetical protein